MPFESIQKQLGDSVLELRPLETGDINAVHALDTRWSLDTVRFRIDTDQTAFDVVGFCNDQLIAVSLASIVVDEFSLLNIVVAPAYRQQGIGHWLLSTQLNAAEKAGCTVFFLEVRPGNTNAVRLYQKLGFQPEGVRTGYYQNPREDALLMAKRVLRIAKK